MLQKTHYLTVTAEGNPLIWPAYWQRVFEVDISRGEGV